MAAVTPTSSTLRLSIYGLDIVVESDWTEVLEAIRLDFAWFEAATTTGDRADVHVRVEQGDPGYQRYEGAGAAFVTPRNVVFRQPGRTIIDYFGHALSVVDETSGTTEVRGDVFHVVHEAVYQLLLSRLGEHFDHIGMPRLHGVGLAGRQGGVVVMLPSGGGKTTLAMRALRDDAVKLVSDDSPLLDRRGFIHPFPLRMGVNETDASALPSGHVRRIERSEFHPKLALELEAFSRHVSSEPVPLRHIVIGRRSLAATASIERMPRHRAAGTLFREVVVGVGLYQGMEFVLQRGLRDVFGKADVAARRALRCAAALTQADVWLLTLGRDQDENWQTVKRLL